MIFKELEKIAEDSRGKGFRVDYIRNLLKEYLQVYLLSFVYTSAEYNKSLIFTGGTCLRHFYDLDRLSEDVDFDYRDDFDAKILAERLDDFFKKKYKYTDAEISLKRKGGQVLVKFPVLKPLGIEYSGGSNVLYVKMDVSPIPSKNFTAVLSSQSKYGFNYVARHYDLPDLMAGKIHAVLKRLRLKGKDDVASVKGRDYFDLMWFLKRGVAPNMRRLSDMLGEDITPSEVLLRLKEKVENLEKYRSDFRADILPLVRNEESVGLYVDNYRDEFLRVLESVELV